MTRLIRGLLLLGGLWLLAALMGCSGGDGTPGSELKPPDDGGGELPGSVTPRILLMSESVTTTTLVQFTVCITVDGQHVESGFTSRWDWESDGLYDTPFSATHSGDHLFTEAGEYMVTLQVRDSQGRRGTVEATLTVTADPDPIDVTLTPSPASGTTATDFTFTAAATRPAGADPDEQSTSGFVRWDWNNDGQYDTPFTFFLISDTPGNSIPPSKTYRFSSAGAKIIRAQVKIEDGRVGEGVVTVSVQ